VDYRVFGAGVLIQSGGKRLGTRRPQPLVEVPDIRFEVFFEVIHPMNPGHTVQSDLAEIMAPHWLKIKNDSTHKMT
jgi:hypothetical protein